MRRGRRSPRRSRALRACLRARCRRPGSRSRDPGQALRRPGCSPRPGPWPSAPSRPGIGRRSLARSCGGMWPRRRPRGAVSRWRVCRIRSPCAARGTSRDRGSRCARQRRCAATDSGGTSAARRPRPRCLRSGTGWPRSTRNRGPCPPGWRRAPSWLARSRRTWRRATGRRPGRSRAAERRRPRRLRSGSSRGSKGG